MLRLISIVIAVCVMLIAASFGAVIYLIFNFSAAESAIAGLAVLMILTLYNLVSARLQDHSNIAAQLAELSHGTADLARQVMELGRRVMAMDEDAGGAERRVRASIVPLFNEIGELGTLVKHLAETVASHEQDLEAIKAMTHDAVFMPSAIMAPLSVKPEPVKAVPAAPAAPAAKSPDLQQSVTAATSGPLKGKTRDEAVSLVREAVEEDRLDLYLQPILTLPQRKIRYYEGMARLRDAGGDIILPVDFLPYAEAASLMPRIDNMILFRCVQVLRRLLAKNQETGLFCNISATTLADAGYFAQFVQFMDANRVLSDKLALEFTQNALAAMGPVERENLAALERLGFRFSMDQVSDLRFDPRELYDLGVRFVKVQAGALLNKSDAAGDIHTADLSDLLGRHGITLIAERIETETMVVDLLDYNIRFGQGFLFSPPRPVRAEAMQDSVASVMAIAPVPAQAAVVPERAGAPSRIPPMADANPARERASVTAEILAALRPAPQG